MTGKAYTIGIDCRFAKTKSGIGRYTRELKRELKRRNDPWSYVFLEPDIPHYSLAEQLQLPKAIRTAHIDLLHVPHFNVPFNCPVPFIATIHDLILHSFPNEASLLKRAVYRTLMKNTVTKAKHLIAVSQFTADELKREYGENVANKTSVIHEGVSPQFHPASEEEKQRVRTKYNLPERFLLYVGSAKQHKNVQTLIDACPNDLPLVLKTTGRESQYLSICANTQILDCDDTDLPALYSATTLYVHPSLAEGFGLPILEAMACGTTVVASNCGSIPKITGGRAILVEPTVEGLRQGIEDALEAPSHPDQMVQHARNFSWETMAEETAVLYASALHGSHLHPPPQSPPKARTQR